MAPVAIYTTSSNNKKITNEIASAVINSIAYSTVNKKEFMPLRIYHEGEKHGPYESLLHQGSGPRNANFLLRNFPHTDGAIGLGEATSENFGAPAIKAYSTLNFKNTNSFYRHLYASAEEKLGKQYGVQLEFSDACKEWVLPGPALSDLEGKIFNMVFGLSRIGEYLEINDRLTLGRTRSHRNFIHFQLEDTAARSKEKNIVMSHGRKHEFNHVFFFGS
jgi:hypothetical protein